MVSPARCWLTNSALKETTMFKISQAGSLLVVVSFRWACVSVGTEAFRSELRRGQQVALAAVAPSSSDSR